MQQEYERLLTVREVAQQFRVDATTVRRWILQGTLPAVDLYAQSTKNRGCYRVKETTVQHIIDGQKG